MEATWNSKKKKKNKPTKLYFLTQKQLEAASIC